MCVVVLQQHGSVYWRVGAEGVLMSLNGARSMAEQLAVCLCYILSRLQFVHVDFQLFLFFYAFFDVTATDSDLNVNTVDN